MQDVVSESKTYVRVSKYTTSTYQHSQPASQSVSRWVGGSVSQSAKSPNHPISFPSGHRINHDRCSGAAVPYTKKFDLKILDHTRHPQYLPAARARVAHICALYHPIDAYPIAWARLPRRNSSTDNVNYIAWLDLDRMYNLALAP